MHGMKVIFVLFGLLGWNSENVFLLDSLEMKI